MALPKFTYSNDENTKLREKYTKEIESVLNNNELLNKQFKKDLLSKDANELSLKLYVYKKYNLLLFYTLLKKRFDELVAPDNNLIDLGKIELKDDTKTKAEEIIDSIEPVKENVTQLVPFANSKNWNIFKNYKYEKPQLPDFDIYSIDKMISKDVFLKFVYSTLEPQKGYEETLKTIYNTYIKDDEYLSKQLKVYESYYTINEKINSAYKNIIEDVLFRYEKELSSDPKIYNHIYNELTKTIGTNSEYAKTMLDILDNNSKSELYDFFKIDIFDFLNKFENLDIEYNYIIDSNNIEINNQLKDILGLSEQSVEFILTILRNIELSDLLFIDDEETTTIILFTTLYLILKEVF